MVEFFLAVLIMLATAWALGEVLHRMGQPALVGQLLAGVVIGPSLFNLVAPTAALDTVESVALFFIMLLAGLAVRPDRVVAAGRRGATVSSISFAVPFVAGFLVAHAFGVGEVSSLTVGLTVSITAVPVNSIILMELGLMDTDLGATVITAGVIDDVISFVALGVIQQFKGGLASGDASVAVTVGKMALFLGAVLFCEYLVRANVVRVRAWVDGFGRRLQTQGSYFAMLLLSAVGVSLLAEWAGLQFVVGAFFAGMILAEVSGAEKLEQAVTVVRGVTFGFFGPIAFTFIGTELALSSLEAMPLFVGTLLALAIASKLAGGYAGAVVSGFSKMESLTIGFLMNSRGFVELVIAATAYQLGLVDQSVFSIIVGIGILATIVSPIASRAVMRRAGISGESGRAGARSSDRYSGAEPDHVSEHV